MEPELMRWVLALREKGVVVTRNMIQIKALTMVKATSSSSTFKASKGWCSRFMTRQGLSLRTRTHIAQKLPSDVDVKVSNFQQYVIKEQKLMEYELS